MIEKAISELRLPADRLPGLYEPIVYALDTGGKRLRPSLALTVCAGLCGEPEPALPCALAVEMFHNFTLLHDDVMDCSPLRRGKPTVHARWDANTAILSGDTMLTLATQLLCRLPADKLPRALEMFNRTAIEVYEGQQMDMDFEKRDDVTIPEYIEMIRLKTAVLLGCACALGAIAAGAPDATVQAVYDYGQNLGLAFQIQDDWLDLYGDPATFGKPIGGDVLQNKKTFLLLTALDAGPLEVQGVMAMAPSAEKIETVRGIFTVMGVPGAVRHAIVDYTGRALAALERAGLSPEAHERLAALATALAERTK